MQVNRSHIPTDQGMVAYIKDQPVGRVTHSRPKYRGLLNYVDRGVTVKSQITDIGSKYERALRAAEKTIGLLLSRPIVFKRPLHIYSRTCKVSCKTLLPRQ